MSEYQHQLYRVEWIVEVFAVDQYENRQHEVYYRATFPTHSEATGDLHRITRLDTHTGRRIVKDPSIVRHSYHGTSVTRTLVLVKDNFYYDEYPDIPGEDN